MTSAKAVVSLFPPREAPAPTPFDSWGHRRKLRRGAFHIEEAQAACEGWATGDGFRVFAERDGEGGELVQVEMLKPLPDDLPLMVGDALQCLRTSLDRLTCSLAVANKGSLSAKQEDEVWFPISDQRVTERTAAVELLSKGAKDVIACVAPDPTRLELAKDPLWLLDKTARRERHSGVAVSASAATTAGIVVGGTMWTGGLSTEYRSLEVGAPPVPVGKLTLNNPERAEVRYRVQIQFDAPAELRGRGIVSTLWWFHDHIRDVVFKALEPQLGP